MGPQWVTDKEKRFSTNGTQKEGSDILFVEILASVERADASGRQLPEKL
jgi:hypothetical protein